MHIYNSVSKNKLKIIIWAFTRRLHWHFDTAYYVEKIDFLLNHQHLHPLHSKYESLDNTRFYHAIKCELIQLIKGHPGGFIL